ncbi:hypothetical protein [Ideonella sp. YS5]|uniref:hypothetical protein n=1 Tax=Ideonella sp. YS5 TaxID=3453714 RepID=UPI003EEE3CD8
MREIALTQAPERPSSATPADLCLDDNRHAFWLAFLDWQSSASPEDLAALSQALAPHAQHVRPIHRAISDALQDPQTAFLLPFDLTRRLEHAGWKLEHKHPARVPHPLAA